MESTKTMKAELPRRWSRAINEKEKIQVRSLMHVLRSNNVDHTLPAFSIIKKVQLKKAGQNQQLELRQ